MIIRNRRAHIEVRNGYMGPRVSERGTKCVVVQAQPTNVLTVDEARKLRQQLAIAIYNAEQDRDLRAELMASIRRCAERNGVTL
jgi:hypothetical protein